MTELKEAKAQCLEDLTTHLGDYVNRLNAIDDRLLPYVEDAISNDGSHANLYELLGIRKEFRLMDSYEVSTARVQMSIRAIEGVWENGRHQNGGLKFDTPRGNMHVRLMPYQVWCLFGIYAFTEEVDMEREFTEGDDLLPSEYVKDGRVFDKRRLTTEADLFQTRKSGKTEFGAAIDFTDVCFLGPANGQALICANSHDQAKIAYKAIKEFAAQIDPSCLNRMGGRYFRLTATEMSWQPGHKMKGEIKTLAAGGKFSRDGLFASIVHADEHGSARYVAGMSDMQELVNVCAGSMGPRRESLILHTTTAGLVNEGPYKNQLETVEKTLLEELNYPLGEPCHTDEDHRFSFLLRLDPWEVDYELDQLDDTELFKKVNRSIGITVQPTWYKKRLHEARKDDDVKKEVLTKDFNIWQNSRITSWAVTADKVRRLQEPRRVTDCLYRDGWNVFVGLDFSSGEDLFALTYLCVNYSPGLEMLQRFFADTTVWIVESELKRSPNRPLYERWIADGWMHVCPGDVFDPDLAINEMMSMSDAGVNLYGFGYDPAQSRQPINTLKAWLQSIFKKANPHLKASEIADMINDMVTPVSQNFMTMNPAIGELEHYILTPWLHFSQSPLWPWQVGNVRVETSRDETLRKLMKSGANNKVDSIHALLDAIVIFDLSEGKIKK